ncbi:glutamine amidotransferase, partial [Candidatus Bathyarchaeota archaeon]|nr:glutamine amidotransferase [Candidatus Bathyarchaeota archaeon]
MLLVVDNGSIYTKNLLEFLSQLDIQYVSKSYDGINLDNLDEYSSFILSGRRQNNKKMNSTNSQIIKLAISKKKPLLGICYG